MKTIIKIFFATALAVVTLSGCVKEVFPQQAYATAEQVGESAAALEASLNGIPSQMCQGYMVYGVQNETDMGYPSVMLSLSEALGDIYPMCTTVGYDHYHYWNTFDEGVDESSSRPDIMWRTLYIFIKSANDIIGTINLENEDLSDEIRGYAGVAYAYRAFNYYYLMTMYEPADNIYTDCSGVLGLTVPIVTPDTVGEQAANNPRATHDEMVEFILNDLDIAEECLKDNASAPKSKLFPGLAAVYAVKARTYMWDGQWAKAAEYADKAIEIGGAPMTETQWLDVNTAFNTATPGWIWYIHYDAENMGNLCNFTGWISAEADWGYAALTQPCIDRSLYDSISKTDFRKHAFVDPGKYDYYPYKSVVNAPKRDFIAECYDYTSLKFRCVGGDWQNYSVGGACDVPVIRVEEMYFIKAEAEARAKSVSDGASVLNSFMQTYRDKNYNKSFSDVGELAKEILTQMRVEFWGEGTAFATAKRIRPGVMQNYAGTNAPSNIFKINCEGVKPSWNYVIPIAEIQANNALANLNNPDPTGTVVGPSPIGEYAKPGYVPPAEDEGNKK